MTGNDYQRAALETSSSSSLDDLLAFLGIHRISIDYDEDINAEDRASMIMAALGLAGEAGEVADIVKKAIFHKHPYNAETQDKLVKELGDVTWYIARFASTIKTTLNDIMETNITKLKTRYGAKFSHAASINRVA